MHQISAAREQPARQGDGGAWLGAEIDFETMILDIVEADLSRLRKAA